MSWSFCKMGMQDVGTWCEKLASSSYLHLAGEEQILTSSHGFFKRVQLVHF